MGGKGIRAKHAVEPQEAVSGDQDQRPVRKHKGLTWEDWREEDGAAGSQVGPYLSQGAPSSLQHGPGLQATLGALGLQPGPQGAMSAWPLSPAMQAAGYCVGQGGGASRKGTKAVYTVVMSLYLGLGCLIRYTEKLLSWRRGRGLVVCQIPCPPKDRVDSSPWCVGLAAVTLPT